MRACVCDCSLICIGAAGSKNLPPPGGCKTKVPETGSSSWKRCVLSYLMFLD